MAEENHDKLIFNLALLAAGYFFIAKPILEKVGLKKDPDVLATENRNKQLLNDYVNDALKKQNPTKSEEEWKIIADQIYQDLHYSALDDKKADAGYQVARVKNDADMALLIKWFAKRREYWFGVPVGSLMSLQEFITSNLSNSSIATINDNYARKGIKFRF